MLGYEWTKYKLTQRKSMFTLTAGSLSPKPGCLGPKPGCWRCKKWGMGELPWCATLDLVAISADSASLLSPLPLLLIPSVLSLSYPLHLPLLSLLSPLSPLHPSSLHPSLAPTVSRSPTVVEMHLHWGPVPRKKGTAGSWTGRRHGSQMQSMLASSSSWQTLILARYQVPLDQSCACKQEFIAKCPHANFIVKDEL